MSTPTGEVVLALREVTAGYDGIAVVHEVSLDVRAGEIVALLGANGAGKTTTLLTVSGLLARAGGEIEVLGRAVPAKRRPSVSAVWKLARVGVAHVPEDRGLFFDLTARENLRLGRRSDVRNRGDVLPDEQLTEWFPALGRVMDRKAGLLSGGEQQMLAIARAVVSRPRLLLIDEMSLGLAPIVVEQLLPVLRSIATDTGAGILVVEQHVALVLAVAERAYLMRQGRIVFTGSSQEMRDRPDVLEAGYLGG